MATEIPELGIYFEPTEPVSYVYPNGTSYFAGRLGKFNATQWMYKVYDRDIYSVYRMALPAET